MELSNPIAVWLVLGLLLMISEIIIPGGIVILLGAACVIVASAQAVGIIDGLVQSLTLWFMASMVLLLSFRHVTQRLVGGDSHVDNTDEEADLYNQVAIVKQAIGPGQKTALGDGTVIKKGTKVRIICRDNIAFVVEPIIDSV